MASTIGTPNHLPTYPVMNALVAVVMTGTANPNLDGTTGVYDPVFEANIAGARIRRIKIKALGATTAGMIRFFINNMLWLEVPVAAVTPSATLASFEATVDLTGPGEGLELGPEQVITVSTEQAEIFAITVEGANY